MRVGQAWNGNGAEPAGAKDGARGYHRGQREHAGAWGQTSLQLAQDAFGQVSAVDLRTRVRPAVGRIPMTGQGCCPNRMPRSGHQSGNTNEDIQTFVDLGPKVAETVTCSVQITGISLLGTTPCGSREPISAWDWTMRLYGRAAGIAEPQLSVEPMYFPKRVRPRQNQPLRSAQTNTKNKPLKRKGMQVYSLTPLPR